MNRGSVRSLDPQHCAGSCFNEAPIHESGKCTTFLPAFMQSSGFNEAPIHESGKFGPSPSSALSASSLQ